MNAASAEILALNALAFLVNSPEDLDRFMALSGIEPAMLRERAADPEFLAAVVDFLLVNEQLLKSFCEAEALDPRILHIARRALPGGI
ncbi:MAG TPA: DUF3572 domain-containing protein [Rhizomicrobium sp.]|nr:DUF3572 domain-containing protein [Rhizomicrobium sp.]